MGKYISVLKELLQGQGVEEGESKIRNHKYRLACNQV